MIAEKNYSVLRICSAFPKYLSAISAVRILLIISFSLLPFLAEALDVPQLKGYVNDYAEMLSPSAEGELERELRAFEQTDSTQIVILTVPSLEGEVLEEFSIRVAEAWKIGQQRKDNGVILLVAKQERKIRIEVGRGLEGKLTDLMAGRIVDLVIKPRFKRGDFDGGFISGVSSVMDATRGEFKADGNGRQRKKDFSPVFTLLIFGGIALLVLGSIYRVLSAIAGAVGLPVLALLTIGPGLIVLGVLALVGFGLGMLLPALFSAGRHRRGGFRPGGGFPIGGGWSGHGGGDFGGGFSGGGGDFGGGGASGDW